MGFGVVLAPSVVAVAGIGIAVVVVELPVAASWVVVGCTGAVASCRCLSVVDLVVAAVAGRIEFASSVVLQGVLP